MVMGVASEPGRLAPPARLAYVWCLMSTAWDIELAKRARVAAVRRKYYLKTQATQLAKAKAWRVANPDKVKAHNLALSEAKGRKSGRRYGVCTSCGGRRWAEHRVSKVCRKCAKEP